MNGLTRRETPDRGKINLHDPVEAKSWTHELRVSKAQLQKLIEKVGNGAAEVRKELDRQKIG